MTCASFLLRRAASTSMLASMLALAACGDTGGEAPGAVSEGEARALEEAAQMLDEQRLPEGALPQVQPPVEQTPADGAETAEMTGDSAEQ